MTVPIIPGAFSFLPQAANVAKAYTDAREQRIQQDMSEAQQQLASLGAMVKAGFVDQTVLEAPETQQLIQRAMPQYGRGATPIAPNIGQLGDRVKAEQLVPGAPSPLRQLAAGAVTGADVAKNNVDEISSILQADIFKTATPDQLDDLFKRLPAEVAGRMRQAREGQAQVADDEAMVNVAGMFVSGALGDVDAAMAKVSADPGAAKLTTDQRLQRRHFEAAAQAYRERQEALGIKRAVANRPAGRGSAGRGPVDMYKTAISRENDSVKEMSARLGKMDSSYLENYYANRPLDQSDPSSRAAHEKRAARKELEGQITAAKTRQNALQVDYNNYVTGSDYAETVDPTQAAEPGVNPIGPVAPKGNTNTPRVADPKAIARKTSESDAVYWERLKAAGVPPAVATAHIRGK